jgi:hypothetical protein
MLLKSIILITDDETFEVDPEQERRLLAGIAEADRGELVNASDLLQRIRRVPVTFERNAEGVS